MTEDSGLPPDDPTAPPAYPQPGTSQPYAGHPGPGQPAWQPGQQPMFPVYALPDHPKATASLVVGIVSVAGAFLCLGIPLLAAPVAWVLGAVARKEVRRAPQHWGGEGRATAGMVLGIIGTVMLVLFLTGVVILLVVVVNDSSAFDSNTSV